MNILLHLETWLFSKIEYTWNPKKMPIVSAGFVERVVMTNV